MGKLVIYDRRRSVVGGVTVSMVRANMDLHDAPGTTGEVAFIHGDGSVEEVWTGPAAHAGDAFRYAVESLAQGASTDEVADGFCALREAGVLEARDYVVR